MMAQAGPCGKLRRTPLAVKALSNKTILNIHTARSALWTWAVAEGIVSQHLLRQIPRPKPEKRAITPFSEEDMKTLLALPRQTLPRLHVARQARLQPRGDHRAAQPDGSFCCCSTPVYAPRNCAG